MSLLAALKSSKSTDYTCERGGTAVALLRVVMNMNLVAAGTALAFCYFTGGRFYVTL